MKWFSDNFDILLDIFLGVVKWFFIITIFFFFMYGMANLATSVSKRIERDGLKSIVNEIWNGKGGDSNGLSKLPREYKR